MNVAVREVINALQLAIEEQQRHAESGDPYEEGYLDALERAADIVVIKAHGLSTGLEADEPA